jgi:ribosomal protein S19E (S16A)
MSLEFDYDLKPDQWETLKALRIGAVEPVQANRQVLQELVGLGLAELQRGQAVITQMGRRVLVRGSTRLLDLAA